MKLLFDLNSLRPPRSGVGYYTQHLLEGLRDEPDVQGLAGWVGAERFEGERLLALINQRRRVAQGRAVHRRHRGEGAAEGPQRAGAVSRQDDRAGGQVA